MARRDEIPHQLTGRAREIELLLRERRARSRRSDVEVTVPRHLSASKVVAVRPRPRGLRARPAPPDARAACRRRPTGHRVPRLGGAALRPGRHGRPARPARQRRRGPRRRQRPAADEGALPGQRVGLAHPRGDRDRDRDDRGRHRRPRSDRRRLPPGRTAGSPSSTGRRGPRRRGSRPGSGPCSWRPTGWRSRACADSHPTRSTVRSTTPRAARPCGRSCPTRPTSCACCRPCPTETAVPPAAAWRSTGSVGVLLLWRVLDGDRLGEVLVLLVGGRADVDRGRATGRRVVPGRLGPAGASSPPRRSPAGSSPCPSALPSPAVAGCRSSPEPARQVVDRGGVAGSRPRRSDPRRPRAQVGRPRRPSRWSAAARGVDGGSRRAASAGSAGWSAPVLVGVRGVGARAPARAPERPTPR